MIGGVAVLLLLLAYYLLFLRHDFTRNEPAPKKQPTAQPVVEQLQFFAVTQANVRDRPSTAGTTILTRLARGDLVQGTIVTGEDGSTSWLKLADGKGYVATANLSEDERPEIVRILGDRVWKADKALDIYTEAAASAVVYEQVTAGTALTLYGLTASDFVEVKLKRGGVGYIADGARIAEASSAKGPPISVAFNPASCDFGGQLEVAFGKLNAKSRAAYRAIDQTEFASDEARDRALVAFEGKSYYQRLERSYNGLSITGIAQHYESQSVYFADTPDRVLSVFRAAGHKIGRDGQFTNTEIYAGIGATVGAGRKFGKTELSCGV